MKKVISTIAEGYEPEPFNKEFLDKTCDEILEKLREEYESDYDLSIDVDDTAVEGFRMQAKFTMYDGDDVISDGYFEFNGVRWNYEDKNEFLDYLNEEIDEFVYRMKPSDEDEYWYE